VTVSDRLLAIFQEAFRQLRPRTLLPELSIEFYAFANVNHTIRLREGKLRVRLSDLLQGAPEPVLRAIAHILLAKMYRQPIERAQAARYRRYVASHHVAMKAQLVRQIRGRKRLTSPRGRIYDLEGIFDELNTRFFHGLLARPQITWSREQARKTLGHYDSAHNAIVVSRIFDHPGVPRYALEYILYHEMLHLRHPVKLKGSRRCVHSAEFQAEEKLFPQLEAARRFLKHL
jgi:predicted metal-dependent hydrolase